MTDNHETKIASPDGALSFLFCVFGMLFWFSRTSALNSDALFSIGCIQIILGIGAFAASLLNMVRGKPRGNINLMATILLGFFPGFNTLISLIALSQNIHFQPRVYGLMYIVGAVFCIGVMIKRYEKPLYRFIGTFSIAAALLCIGISDFLLIPVFSVIGGWFMFVFSLEMFYFGISVMYSYYGSYLPQGISLKKWMKRRKYES